MCKLNTLAWIALVLVVIGGLNWGLVGVLNLDVVQLIFGASIISRLIYVLVGLAAIYLLISCVGKKGQTSAAPMA
jgi:uncharacterized membrane protein YuzA (DUF378 family)